MIVIELSTFQKKFKGNRNIIMSIYRIPAYDSIMDGYFYTGFIDFMLKDDTN